MLISASIRPRGLKKGVTSKRLCKSLGFDEIVGLEKIVGRLELSAERGGEFAFLRELFQAVHPIRNNKARVEVYINDEHTCTYEVEPKL